MSLSKFIQSPDLLAGIPGKKTSELKSSVLAKGTLWYSENPEETELITTNLQKLGLSFSDDLVEKIKYHSILHYYEKLLPLCGGPEFFFNYLQENVECQSACETLKNTIANGKGALVSIAHFGAVEFLGPAFSTFKLPVNVVLRFTTEAFSKIAHSRAEVLEKSGYFSPIKFIEIGKPGASPIMDMAAALRRKEILISVFDEKTDFSKPVNLFGKKLYGGAGLDKLIQFAKDSIDVFTAFMVRTGDDRYRLELIKLVLHQGDILQQMYDQLQKIVDQHLEQWYFLHEEVPFFE